MKKLAGNLAVAALAVSLLLVTAAISPAAGRPDELESMQKEDYAAAMKLSGQERIAALTAFTGKYSAHPSVWVCRAHAQLASAQFDAGQYQQSARHAMEALKFASLEAGEEGRLYSLEAGEEGRLLMILALCFSKEDSPIRDRDKALQYVDQAITHARAHGLQGLLDRAVKLKATL